ncbi:MAG TPA: formimidoylglutamate deiminase [Thermomicrobiales bacterium]|nr:formimidoylglutamate deiminase [Thermomicrobiales bacterium]
MRRTLAPDFILAADGAHAGLAVTIEDGRIVAIGPATDGERLPGRALAPGFVNDHSHAFQLDLRGAVERVRPGVDRDDFWTWREEMYAAAERLNPDTMRRVAERCYRGMLAAGYTSVTEFHYVHHQPDGGPYPDPNALAKTVAEAAESVGIRLTLLPTAYARGGLPLFRDASVTVVLERVDALRQWAADRPLLRVGLAAHSVRAVPRDWLEALGAYARRHDVVLHMHADEQPAEIRVCLDEHGLRPIELLAETGFLGPQTTVIHATHADDRELDLLAAHGAGICVCPTTEGNLGDGFLPAEGVRRRGIRLSIGSDQHVRLDPFEELRELETNARRLAGRRNVLVDDGDDSPAPYLLRAGWRRAALSPGDAADFIEIDLTHRDGADVAPEHLTAALIFSAGRDVVAETYVDGVPVYRRDG